MSGFVVLVVDYYIYCGCRVVLMVVSVFMVEVVLNMMVCLFVIVMVFICGCRVSVMGVLWWMSVLVYVFSVFDMLVLGIVVGCMFIF